MKKIYSYLLLAMGVLSMGILSMTFISCSNDDLISTASADDDPRIIDPVFPDREKGKLATFAEFYRDSKLSMTLTVTPADYTTCEWFLDDVKVAEGKTIEKELEAGTYDLKIVATTTAGKSTSREGLVKVKPLDGDPTVTTKSFERIVAPGNVATLYGTNLTKVMAVVIDGQQVTDIELETTDDGQKLQYLVPETIKDGTYRISLIDNEGKRYGADLVNVSSKALVTAGASRANANAAWTLTGINLDKVTSITVDDQTVTDFISQNSDEIVLTCPALAEGEHKVTGKTKDGSELTFYTANGIANYETVTISSERTLWEGHHYVSWDKTDGDPNKTFNLIGMDVFAKIKAGTILKVYYSTEPSAEYHQMQLMTGWWTLLPGTQKMDVNGNGSYTYTLTQEALDLIQAQSGFQLGGHGFYVDRVTVQ